VRGDVSFGRKPSGRRLPRGAVRIMSGEGDFADFFGATEPRRGLAAKIERRRKKGNGLGAAIFALVCDSCGKTGFGSWGVVVRGAHAKPRTTRRGPGTKAVCLLCVPAPLREHRSFARAHGMERIPRGAAEGGGRKNRKKTQKRGTVVVPPFLRLFVILAAKPVSDLGARLSEGLTRSREVREEGPERKRSAFSASLRKHRSFARAHGMERIPRGASERGGRKNRKKTQKGERSWGRHFCACL